MSTKTTPPVSPTTPAPAEPGSPAVRPESGTPPVTRPSESDVAAFVKKVKALTPVATAGRGRLVFAMDATMSRQPTWDMALTLQGDMFASVKEVGGLDVQLVYFRGADECRASKWASDPDTLAALMRRVECHGGYTQIRKVLSHAAGETSRRKVNALVYVGDACEEAIDDLCGRAGPLALSGVPVFLFQEGGDATATKAFKEIARLTKGAYCRFDAGSAAQLRELLTAVAVYAAGGRKALLALSSRHDGAGARLLIGQMKPGAQE